MTLEKEKIIYALLDSPEAVESALKRLDEVGVSIDDVSVLMTEDTRDADFAALELTKTTEGVATGSVLGGFVGMVVGGLVALGSAATGGIGLLVMGPAVAFAAAGGLIGGLVGHGIPEAEAKILHDEVAAGRVLLAVHIHDGMRVQSVRNVLEELHAEPVEMPKSHAAEALSV